MMLAIESPPSVVIAPSSSPSTPRLHSTQRFAFHRQGLFLDPSCLHESLPTLHLPDTAASDLRLALDYVYRGQMVVGAGRLAHVLAVLDLLRMKCGVSVSRRRMCRDQQGRKEGQFRALLVIKCTEIPG